MSMSETELFAQLSSLRTKYRERDEQCRASWLAYTGEYDRLFSEYQGSPLDVGKAKREHTIQKWNLVRPIVDNHRVLINQLPSIEVPPPMWGDELAAMKADKQEKILYAWWDTIAVKRKHGEASFNLALHWSTVFQAAWDQDRDIPDIIVRSPAETYPVMMGDGHRVAYCFFRWEEDIDTLAESYPTAKPLLTRNNQGHNFSHKIEVVEYVSDNERLLLIGGDVKRLVPKFGGNHKLSVCPVEIVSACYVPGVLFPPGPVIQLVPMNDHLNRFQTKLSEAIEETLFGWHDLMGEGATDAPINMGPGAVNRYEDPNFKHEYTQPQAPPAQAFGHIEQVWRHMRNLANWPESASGEMNASVITGKGVSRLQGVMAAQAAEMQANLGDGLKRMNEVGLRMLETYRPDKKYELYATESITATSAPGRPRNFGVTFVPREDIQGYYINALHYSPFGTDLNTSINTGLRLVDARIFPRSWLRNLVPGGSDAEGLGLEIEEEDRRRMQIELDLQIQGQERLLQAQFRQQQQLAALQQPESLGGTGAAAPAPGPGIAPQQQGGLPPQMASGGQMIGNTMLMPGGQPQLVGMGEPVTGEAGFPIDYTPLTPFGPALTELAGTGVHGAAANEPSSGVAPGEQPGPGAITLDEAMQILSGIEKLKGQVFLLEDIVDRGFTEGKVVVGLTNMIDKATITNAIRTTKLYGRVRFVDISDGVPTGAIPVAGQVAQAA